MTVESFYETYHFKRLPADLKEMTQSLFEQLDKKGLRFKIHTGEAYNRFVLWADEAIDRKRDRDFLTIFTKKNSLLLWPKFYGLSWKSNEAIKLQKEVNYPSQIDKEFFELSSKAYKSICRKDSRIGRESQ